LYYPSISIAMLRHTSEDLQFTVISSQSMGTTSYCDGGLEMMLHRSLGQDDGRGLGEGVKESNIASIQQWILVGTVENAELSRRRLSLQQDHPLTAITPTQLPSGFLWPNHFVNSYIPLERTLPSNVHLLSLRARDAVSSEVALRLVNIAEGTAAVAAPASVLPQDFQSAAAVKLDQLFSTSGGWTIEHPRERSVSLNYGAEEVEHRVRYDSTLGILQMNIDFSKKKKGSSQNTNEEGVFISQVALDKMERKSEGQLRKLLSIEDNSYDSEQREDEPLDRLDDETAYDKAVEQRGQNRRIFDPESVSIHRQRKLLALGKNANPLDIIIKPLQVKTFLLTMETKGRMGNEQPLYDEIQQPRIVAEFKKPEQQKQTKAPLSEQSVLAAQQQFLSSALEAERLTMIFLMGLAISLIILAYLAFQRKRSSSIISVSSLATSGNPWSSSKDFYRREMEQRLYSKMV